MPATVDAYASAVRPGAAGSRLSTPGRRWRFRRDLVIYLAHARNGISQRVLADVFDLPRSRIGEIIKTFRALEATPRQGGPATPPGSGGQCPGDAGGP